MEYPIITTESPVLRHTVGRATNDVLEAATAVALKHEGEDSEGAYGPVFIITGGAPGNVLASGGEWHEYHKDGETEWFTEAFALALAAELGAEYGEV